MGTLTHLPKARKPTVTTSEDASGAIVVRVEACALEDKLVPLNESGLEERAWKALVKSGELPARKIGRVWYTTRSALVRLVLDAPKVPKAELLGDVDADYASLAAAARGGGRR